MDVELMCLMRHLRRSGRSAWGRGHPREKPAVDDGLGVSAGKLVGIKDGPGLMRQHQIRDLTTEPVREDTAADAE